MFTPKPTTGDTSWFVHDRFGMFIHWGLYALPARHEWVLSVEKIDPADYAARYLPRFNPTLYDPRQWARTAREAGMKYAVLTAKHHEGTQNGNKVYVHVFAWPFKHLHLPELGGKVEFARFLHDGSEVPITGSEWDTQQLALQPHE